MNHYLKRLDDAPGQILAHKTAQGGIGYAVHASNYGPVRLIAYDLEEAEHEGAECVVYVRSFLTKEKALAAYHDPKLDIED